MRGHGHRRGWEEPPSNQVGRGVGEKKWRQDGMDAPVGRLGEGFTHLEWPTHSEGSNGDAERPLGDWRIRKEQSQCFPRPPGPYGAC